MEIKPEVPATLKQNGITSIEISDEEEDEEEEHVGLGKHEAHVPEEENFYPIFLPIDRNYEAKYLFHYRYMKKKGKSIQERVYVFLEHPAGWSCLVYHISV